MEALADMTPEQLEAIEGIGPKTVEKISLAVNNYFASLEAGETAGAAEGEAAAEGSPAPEDASAEVVEAEAAEQESAGESVAAAEETAAAPETAESPVSGQKHEDSPPPETTE